MSKPFHQSVTENFPKELSIVSTIEMLRTDFDLFKLYNTFYKYKDKVFESHERILILLIDTDYYPSADSVGNNIFNLFQIISTLDISTNHIIILSNAHGIRQEIHRVCDLKNLSYPKVIDFVLWYTYPNEYGVPATIEYNKSFLYSCLNGVSRTHRKTLMALLYKNNLVDKGLLSYNVNCSTTKLTNSSNNILQLNNIYFRINVPFTRINEDLSLCKESKKLHVEYANNLAVPLKSKDIVGEPNSTETRWRADFLQKSLVYIITETTGNYPYPFLTEKTWKAIVSQMPFMIVGSKHSLKLLKDLGFKTFDNFWDESYDNEESLYTRCNIIINNLKYLDTQDWTSLAKKLQPIVDYNFNHLQTVQQNELDKIKNILL